MNILPHEWLGDLATYLPTKDLVTFLKVDSYVYLSILISCFKVYTPSSIHYSNVRVSFISYNYFQYIDWYFNGQLWERSFFINGKRHGQYEYWHENENPGYDAIIKMVKNMVNMKHVIEMDK